jgi:hypothetical protein
MRSLNGHPIETTLPVNELFPISQAFLHRTVQDLKEYVQGWTTEPVFNLDEVGISDWEDRKTRNIAVPAAMLSQTIHHGISRTFKHILVVACACTTEKSLIPYIILSQDSPSLREQVKKHGVQFGTDLILMSNVKPSINAEIFSIHQNCGLI